MLAGVIVREVGSVVQRILQTPSDLPARHREHDQATGLDRGFEEVQELVPKRFVQVRNHRSTPEQIERLSDRGWMLAAVDRLRPKLVYTEIHRAMIDVARGQHRARKLRA